MDADKAERRRHLVLAEQQSVADYDKAILALAGGGLGVSIAFIRDIVGARADLPFGLLYWSWGVWAGSMASTLLSFYASRLALRKAIHQLDAGERETGGCAAAVTEYLNLVSGLAFLAGLVLIAIFVRATLGGAR